MLVRNSGYDMKLVRTKIGLTCFILFVLTACSGTKDDPNMRVSAYREGRSESDLRREVGSPTSERRTNEPGYEGSCKGTSAELELTYDVPSRGAEMRIRKLLRMPPAFSYVLCVDKAGRIIRFSTVHINGCMENPGMVRTIAGRRAMHLSKPMRSRVVL
jgi:hypothetical protein